MGILSELILGPGRERKAAEAETAFNTALGSFTNPGTEQQGPPLPGSESGMYLNPSQAAGLQELYQASPQLGGSMLQQMLGANQRAHQNKLGRDLSWESAAIARETLELNEERHDQRVAEYENTIDPVLQAQLAMARETDVQFLNDPLTGTMTRVPAPGTDDWTERTEQATAAAEAAELYNAYATSVAQFGVIEDPREPGFGAQDGMRTDLTFAIKNATGAGALDKGLIDTTERLTGSAYDNRSYWLGNDAESLGRIGAAGRMFENALTRSESATRLLTGWNPEERNRFRGAQERTAQVRDVLLPRTIAATRAAGGQIGRVPQPTAGDPGASNLLLGPLADSAPARAREVGSMLGSQLDNLLSGLLGFAVGRR